MILRLLRAWMKPRAEETIDMSSADAGEITAILTQCEPIGPTEQARLMSLMYPELKRIAERRMRGERGDHTLQPTGLVNEFYLHFDRLHGLGWKNRSHFLAVASNVMRRVLVDYARARKSDKRGGGANRLQLEIVDRGAKDPAFDVLEIHLLLARLAGEEPRMARVVELRYFGGLTNK